MTSIQHESTRLDHEDQGLVDLLADVLGIRTSTRIRVCVFTRRSQRSYVERTSIYMVCRSRRARTSAREAWRPSLGRARKRAGGSEPAHGYAYAAAQADRPDPGFRGRARAALRLAAAGAQLRSVRVINSAAP
jgi:hypothetical protein